MSDQPTLAMQTIQEARTRLQERAAALVHDSDIDARDAIRPLLPEASLSVGLLMVEASGILPQIEARLKAERSHKRGGGRHPKITVKAFLAIWFASQISFIAPTYGQIRNLASQPMDRATREMLGFEVDTENDEQDAKIDAARMSMHEDVIRRITKKISDLMDPMRMPLGHAPTKAEIAFYRAQRDPEDDAARQAFAIEFATRLLYATLEMWPQEARDAWKGDLSSDGTTFDVYGQWGNSDYRRVKQGSQHQELVAHWTRKEKDSRDPAAEPKKGEAVKRSKMTPWGYKAEAHVTVTSGEGVGEKFPGVALTFKVDRPGKTPGLNIIDGLNQLDALENPPPKGNLVGDNGITQVDPENFAIHLHATGRGKIIDYKKGDGGQQTDIEFVDFKDGNMTLPCLPPHLGTITEDLQAGRIDKKTASERYEERAQYLARLKEWTNKGRSITAQCPAQGPGRTIACPRRPDSIEARKNKLGPDGRPLLGLVIDPPEEDLACCTNKESFTIAMTPEALKVYQAMAYGTAAHRRVYAQRRNQIEKFNLDMKTATKAGLKLPDHRRKRGYGKTVLVIAAKIVATNVAATFAWQEERKKQLAAKASNRGRPSKSELNPVPMQTSLRPLRVATEKSYEEEVA